MPAQVLGVSMGGRIALALALAEPGLVGRLILVSTGARVVPSWRRRLMALASRIPIAGSKYPQPAYAFKWQLAASDGFDVTARLHEIAVPALILHGARDRTAPLVVAEEMHAALVGSTMRTFPGGHLFMLMGQRRQFLDAVTR